MISACMTVSVRELRTAVREWACCHVQRYVIYCPEAQLRSHVVGSCVFFLIARS